MQLLGPCYQNFFSLGDVRVGHAAIHRADCSARFTIIKADTLGTLLRYDIKDSVCDRRMLDTVQFPLGSALINRRVGALWLTCPAIDALTGNHRCHTASSPCTFW